MKEFKNNGMKVQFIHSPEFNTDALNGKLVITTLATVAELEREAIQQRPAEVTQARQSVLYSTSSISKED